MPDGLLELSHLLQAWRPDEFTLELADTMHAQGVPFCSLCADWHFPYEDCSATLGADDIAFS